MTDKQYVFYQGEFPEEKDVSINMRSKAFNYGLVCFEGIRAYWNEEEEQLYGFCFEAHYKRLLESAVCLNMKVPYTAKELSDITKELLRKNNCKTGTYIRPMVYKGANTLKPTLLDDDDRILIYTQPLGSYAGKDEFRVAVSSWRRVTDTSLPARTKASAAYLNSALASSEIVSRGYDEAVILTNQGFICEGPGENIFFVKDGVLLTPPPSDDILIGITRNLVMKIAAEDLGMEVRERSIARTELYNSEEVFFSGTAMEVTAVVEADDRMIGDGSQGPVCGKLKGMLKEIGLGKNPKYAHLCTPVYDK